jgi:signal transduction histidine kinase/ActR/RegA family two-component response regulator
VKNNLISTALTRLRHSSGGELATSAYTILEPLKWLTGCVLTIIAVHFTLNLGALNQPHTHSIALIDLGTLFILGSALVLLFRSKVPDNKAQPFGAIIYFVTVLNIIATELLRRKNIDIIYLPFVLISAGVVLLSSAWFVSALSFSIALALPTVLVCTPKSQMAVVLTMLFAGIVISASVFASRVRSHRRIVALRQRDRDQTHSLKEALASLEDKFREHRDMDQRRQELEDQLRQAQKLEAVGVLAGGVAHDMNNVLGAITSVVSLATDRVPLEDPLRQDLEDILSAARRGSTLTRNLLGFARQGTHCHERFQLNETVPSVLRLLQRTISKQVELSFTVASDLDDVEGDSGQMSHVLMNLCINSVDAIAGNGKLSVTVRNRQMSEPAAAKLDLIPGRYVEIRVDDTGQGIPADVLNRVFEPFFSTKSRTERSGLGLSMAYGTVKEYGGAISIESFVGRGTQVSVFLPSLPAKCQSKRPPSVHPPAFLESRQHILLVDDEPLLRTAGKRLILGMGFSVITAANGAEAVAAYRMHQDLVALVILDVAMPVMSGIDCFRRLKEVNSDVCVLIASGYSQNGDVDGLLAAGAAGYLGKPYDKRELHRAIVQALSIKTSSSQMVPGSARLPRTGSENL